MDVRLPLIPNVHINAFVGGAITELESGITNGVVHKKGEVVYVTQRPGVDIVEDASTHIADTKGRGLYYWPENSTLYIINGGTLYKASQAISLSTSPTAGTERCYFFALGGVLLMLDPQNDEAWSITTGDTVAQITDTDFPTEQTPAVGLAHGGAVLNNALYVLGENGTVYGSDDGTGTAWSALNFIDASRSADGGVFLGSHHDNLVVMGPASMEFFYDAGNSTGSPLSRRQDVSYSIGCAFGQSVWHPGDRLFFVGVDESGALGVFLLEQFAPRKISTDNIEAMLTQAVVKDSYGVIGSGFSAAGHDYYTMTLHTTPDSIWAETTLIYDDTVGLWYIWDLAINSISNFPLVDWTKREGLSTQYGQGILSNGDIISANDDLLVYDTLLGATYVDTDYVATGYVASSADSGTAIAMTVRTGMFDGQTNRYKYPESIRFVGNRTPNSQTLTIKWANENNVTFNAGRSQDTSLNSKEHRLGRFQRRNHEISYSGTDKIWLEALEMPVEGGNN